MATNSLGLLFDRRGRSQEAMQFLEQSLALTRRIVAVSTSVHDSQVSLAATLVNVGSLHKDAGRPTVALPLLTEAEQIVRTQLELAPGSKSAELTLFNALWFQGQVGGDLGDANLQADAGRRLAVLRPTDGRALRIAGALYSEALGLLANDTTVAADDKTTRQAAWEKAGMELLQQAAAHGCIDLGYLRDHEHLRALRALPGYDAVLRQVAANVEAAERGHR
jgi:tetratricopeptide (TPR) repeat protein